MKFSERVKLAKEYDKWLKKFNESETDFQLKDCALTVITFLETLKLIEPQEWISVKDRLPVCEEKVLVQAVRTFKGGDTMTIITTGMYEDGTISECDSRWNWEDVNYEKWDDENDCMIIPKSWWEDKAYNPDGALNYQIDDEVVAWMPLPSPYKGDEE